MRQVVLDTETTGLEVRQGHRVIEIGCVELLDRRPSGKSFHQYLNPEREIDQGAYAVHGISLDQLKDEPRFSEVCNSFLEFVDGAELIIHNAPFDLGFLDAEIRRLESDKGELRDRCKVLDSLALARSLHPGQKNTLDALCKRYEIDNSHREMHGALLDARILADVYLAMTSGQVSLGLGEDMGGADKAAIKRSLRTDRRLKVILANEGELASHEARLEQIEAASGKRIWRD